jgi:hypothetical protein
VKRTSIKTFLSIIIIIFSYTSLHSQESEPDKINLKSLSGKKDITLKEIYSKNTLKDFPFQFGVSGGAPIPFNSKNFYTYGFFMNLNVNISLYKYFLKLEYGWLGVNREILNNRFERINSQKYFLLGFSVYLFKIREYPMFFDLGLAIASNKEKNSYTGGGSLGLKFLYPVTKVTSISGIIKFPFVGKSYNDEYYLNPFLTIGIQFF